MISFKTPSSHLFLPEIQALQTLLENKPTNSCDAQMAMAPMPRPINRGDKAGKPRVGAVLALLYPKQDDIHLILTKRPDSMRDHSGQVSFPGGKQDAGETLPQTALRETHEEIGIPPHEITLLGRLSSLY
ncbi:MAG: CoA pyrophosphatase, partial [Methylococcales bacterium]|nr:CoA pyrophosphatase [Methylococcales bacterium]